MQKLLNLNRYAMYSLLVIFVSVPLFLKGIVVPTLTSDSTEDLYVAMHQLPEGSTIFLESDWTVSTRGESRGQLEAALKIIRLKNLKFVLFSGADPQAPQVARNVILDINKMFAAKGIPELKAWEDYVDVGFYPDVEALWQTVASDPRKTFEGRRAFDPTTNTERGVYESPVLSGIRRPTDIGMVINITASATIDVIVQRMSGKGVKVVGMLTGVMAPEAMVYYSSRQLVGISGGLRGVVELETMMKEGVNYAEPGMEPFVKAPQYDGVIPPIPIEYEPLGRGMNYFVSLHAALTLLILSVALGNIGLYASRKKGDKK